MFGRFLTPDWAAKATAVPYAEFADPQSLNLYSYVRNVPTVTADTDGHCSGDECKGIAVTVQVTSQPAFRTNEKQSDGTYETGVRGQLTITLTKDGKPMTKVPVKEKITGPTTRNGAPVKTTLKTGTATTNAAGQVKDDVGLQLPTKQPASKDTITGVKADQTQNTYTSESTQTLTFPGQSGATCSCTYQRTLTNDSGNGNPSQKNDSSGSNYTLKTSTQHPHVKEQK